MEEVNFKRRHGQAKVIGTLVVVAGALLMIIYKGPVVEFVWSKGRAHHASGEATKGGNFLMGTLTLLAGCVSWAAFYIVQVMIAYIDYNGSLA